MPERLPEEIAVRPRGRCRCGHLPTHHLRVRPTADGTGYRLLPVGACSICGELGCRQYGPAAG